MGKLRTEWEKVKKDSQALKELTGPQKQALAKTLKSFNKGLGKQLDALEKAVTAHGAANADGERGTRLKEAKKAAAAILPIVTKYRSTLTKDRTSIGNKAWAELDGKLEAFRQRARKIDVDGL